jgi:hypothetical protein
MPICPIQQALSTTQQSPGLDPITEEDKIEVEFYNPGYSGEC